MAEPDLLLPKEDLAEIGQVFARHLPEAEVWICGSRVRGTAHETSDLDLVVRNPADLEARNTAPLHRIRAVLREGNLPLLVDLRDWSSLNEAARRNSEECHAVLRTPASA